jgi:hypothetical protein
MLRKYLGPLVLAWFALLTLPSVGHANILDWIWTMSGPQMVGLVLHCEYDVQNNKSECRMVDRRFVGGLTARQYRRVWLSIDTGFYVSTGYDSETTDYTLWKDQMIAFEPMLEMRSYSSKDGLVDYHHGLIGISWDLLTGTDHATFDKFGLKFRPVGITIKKKWNMSYTLRLYPNGFSPDEFDGPSVPNLNRGLEVLHGFTFGILWGPKPPPPPSK